MVGKKGESGISDDLKMNIVVYKSCKVEIVKIIPGIVIHDP